MSQKMDEFEKLIRDKASKLNEMLEHNQDLLSAYSVEADDDKEIALEKELLNQSTNLIRQCFDNHNRILDIFGRKD